MITKDRGPRGYRGHKGKRGSEGALSSAFVSASLQDPVSLSSGVVTTLNFNNILDRLHVDVVPVSLPTAGYGFKCLKAGTYFFTIQTNVIFGQIDPSIDFVGTMTFELDINGVAQVGNTRKLSKESVLTDGWRSLNVQWILPLQEGDVFAIAASWNCLEVQPIIIFDTNKASLFSMIRIGHYVNR